MNRRISVNTGSAVPQSFITKGKQRLKQHIDTVYLNNGDEFEVELYNPTYYKVLAKIELNGNSIGNGIVLRPGERVFLERYLDVAKKFKFETYMVDGESKEVENAIRNNGDVVIKFYDEYIKPLWNNSSITYTTYPSTFTLGTPNYFGATYTTNGLSGTLTSSASNDAFFTTTISNSNVNARTDYKKDFKSSNSLSPQSLETGRVEQGSSSNQTFDYDNTLFNTYASQTNWWKLKPQSTKPLVREDLVVYCTECGSKRKKDSHKFCPHCGTKY